MAVVTRSSAASNSLGCSATDLQSAIQSAVTPLVGRVQALESDNLTIRKENAEMKAAIDKIRFDAAVVIMNLNEKIAALQGEIASLGGELDSEKAKRSELEGKVTTLSAEIKALTEKVEKQAADILAKDADLTQKSAEAQASEIAEMATKALLEAEQAKRKADERARIQREINQIHADILHHDKTHGKKMAAGMGAQATAMGVGAVVLGPIGILGGMLFSVLPWAVAMNSTLTTKQLSRLYNRGKELSSEIGAPWPPNDIESYRMYDPESKYFAEIFGIEKKTL